MRTIVGVGTGVSVGGGRVGVAGLVAVEVAGWRVGVTTGWSAVAGELQAPRINTMVKKNEIAVIFLDFIIMVKAWKLLSILFEFGI